ncbi:MAG TPA: hypothetical protein VJ963_09975, partial [Bacteroidales bacterium]|nr:hypothetical protein [Bacteroidales bacterium]
ETKQAQWSESVHATGTNAAYADRTGCVRCHTSQGFLEYVAEGSDADISVPTDPMQINCYTCHQIHTTFTSDDWALTKPGAETLILQYDGAAIVYDNGNSNQCVGCHQAREVSPAPVLDGADFEITNNRIGVHHAPMANFLLGKLPFELPGETYPTSNPHFGTDGCITCHMATPYGYQAGGHNMGMTYEQHGTEEVNTNGCMTCHSTTPDFESLQAEVSAKLDTLRSQLTAAGIYDPSSELANKGTFSANAVLAYLNYDAVTQDKSLGVHNPGYINALLDNSISAMVDLGYPAALTK